MSKKASAITICILIDILFAIGQDLITVMILHQRKVHTNHTIDNRLAFGDIIISVDVAI